MAKQRPAPPQKPVFGGRTVCKQGEEGKPEPYYFEVRVNGQDQACALWQNHGSMFDTLDKLKEVGVLNVHERQLLEFGVIR